MDPGEEEAVASQLKRRLEDGELQPEETVSLLNHELNEALRVAALQTDRLSLSRLKSHLYLSGVLNHCLLALKHRPRRPRGTWSATVTLATITSSCCVAVDAGRKSEAFHRFFLPSVMDALLSLANQLMRRGELSLLRKVMDSVRWLLRAHTQLAAHVLSSVHYELIQMCDDVAVSLLCIQLWTQTCTSNRDFLSGLSEESVLLLLNEAVGQLAVSGDAAVGGASVRLMLLMANQEPRVQPLLRSFRGLDSLLDKDWRGRGFNQEVEQLIALIRSDRDTLSYSQAGPECVRAVCVIQACWRSFQTRRRVKTLNRAVSTLQRRYRAHRLQQQQQREAQQWEEELKYQVCVRRQQARRRFHQKQRQLLQLLPPDQVQPYLQECERRAAVVIQSFWRGFRERRHYRDTHTHTPRHTHTQQQAARTLQRAVRGFLQRRRAAEAPPPRCVWIGQSGLTDSRRAELKQEVEQQTALHPSSCVSREQCVCLHEEVQLLLLSFLQEGNQRRREEERTETLLAHTHTQLELLREAPPLGVVTATVAEAFLSPSPPVAAKARDAHNALLQAGRLPWWRILGNAGRGPAPLQQLEAELGGLFVGGVSEDGGMNL